MKGIVSFYHGAKQFGFLEGVDGEEYFFRNEKINRSLVRWLPGDEVEFQIIAQTEESRPAAKILSRIGSDKLRLLIEEVKINPKVGGYLKQLPNEKWALKHMPSKIFIPIKGPTNYEDDIEYIYHHRVNEWVEALVKVSRKDKLTATLTDRKFKDSFATAQRALESQEIIEAVVTGQNEDVVFVTILYPPIGATILKKNYNIDWSKLVKNQRLKVRVKGMYDSSVTLTLLIDP